ncbi:phytanoyl-CoA dioxygenase [Xylogone sp. PMI_703]|nr:phytanoyl-CoA dioxygenase [Xylogone sp. PMI_703]
MGSATPLTSSLLESLNRDGFVVVPSVLSAEQLTRLREAAQSTVKFAREGHWKNVRTLPKQFPPWDISSPNPAAKGIWGVQLLMHPELPEHEVFVKTYFSDAVINPTKELLQCGDDELVMELFNLLTRPDRDFELTWHRDDIPATATAEEEMERLSKPAWHAQWNLALYDDSSLIVVPKSHLRARTDVERAADPLEKEMPGQIVVKQRPGDIVFYNNNILHRGSYSSNTERMTLHGSVGHVQGGNHRARNVLQHGVKEWIEQIDLDILSPEEKKRAEGMRARLVKLGEQSRDVGYSLQG